jgi:site-specific recombinase XerD
MFIIHWSPDHDNALKDFRDYLSIRDRRPATIKVYSHAVKTFLERTKKDVEELSEQDVFEHLVFLKEQQGLAGVTINQRRSALRIFFRDILDVPLSDKLLKCSKRPQRIPEVLTHLRGHGGLESDRQSQASDDLDDHLLGGPTRW